VPVIDGLCPGLLGLSILDFNGFSGNEGCKSVRDCFKVEQCVSGIRIIFFLIPDYRYRLEDSMSGSMNIL
jgi:hypothetical protein